MAASKRDFILSSGIGISANSLYLVSTIASTSNSSGALVTRGGVGIGGSLYVASATAISGVTFNAGIITGSLTGIATTAQNINVSNSASSSAHPILISPTATGSGVAVSSNTTLSYNPSSLILSTSGLAVTAATASTNSSTGALVITGGVGIGDSLFVAGNISFNTGTNGLLFRKLVAGNYGAIYSTNVTPSATNYTMITDGASVNFNGTNGVYFNVNNSNKIQVTTNNVNIVPTADSTSTSTGALTVAGGVGIGGSLYVASATAISGVSINAGIITGSLSGTATTATNINVVNASSNSAHPLHFSPSATGSGLATSSNTTLSYNPSTLVLSTSGLAITAGTASTNTSTGALVVSGGVGIGGSLFVNGDLTINGTTTTINSVTLTVDDKNIELGSVTSPSDVTAEGGGITLKGATDKFLNWYTGTGWSSSESFNLINGNTYKIANTTVLSNSSLGTGVTNSSLTALGTITTGTWSGNLITSFYGGTGYNSFTKGDLLVGAGNTFVKLPVGNDLAILTANSSSGSGLSWKGLLAPTYGSFGSTATQPVAGVNTITYVNFNTIFYANNVSIGSGSTDRVYINDSGIFDVQFSSQLSLASGNQPQIIDMWFVVDGVPVPKSGTRQTVTGKDQESVLTVNLVQPFISGQYIQLAYSSPDIHMQLGAFSNLTTPIRPDIPSIFLTVEPISSILPGSGLAITGLASLNLLTSNAQTMVTGTSGNDFNISSIGSVHTFNIPDASATNRGLITTGSQTIAGSKTFSSAIIGSLTGTATTATNVNAVLALTNGSHPVLFTPTFGTASGIAVSSNTTLVYNPSTDILSVSGAAITSSTNSTTTSTGALTVTGGVGIGQSVSIGGRLQLFNSSNYTAFVSSASGNTVYTLPATSPATGSSVLQSTSAGVMSWVPMTAASSSGNTSQNVVINAAGNANVFHPVLFTPSTASAGSAVSSDTTITFNPSTEILSVSGLAITSGTASTNTTTGALIVRGGLGVTGQLSFATASFGFTGITSNPTMSFIGNTSSSPITLTVLTDNSLSWEGTSGQLFSIDNNLTSGDIFSVSDISGLPIINASAGQTVSINEFGGYTRIGNGSVSSTGASSSAADGSLVVYGGVGITGDVSVGGKLQLFNGTRYAAFVSSSTGNTIYTLPATSPATGTSILQATSSGVMSWISPLGVGITVGGALDGSVQYKVGSGLGGTRSFFFNTVSYGLRLGNFPGEEITSGNSAALLIEQSIGSFNGSTNGTLIAANANSGFTGDLINLQVNANTKFRISASGAIGFSSGLTAGGDVSITSNTNSTSTTSGALQVSGGLGVTGNANIGGTVRITNTTVSTSSSSGALTVSGGAGIGQSLFVGGNLNFAGQLRGGTGTYAKTAGSGDICLDNGTDDTPALLFYWGNNRNFGIDAFYPGTGTTKFRIVKELNESGGTELWSIDRNGLVNRSAWAPGETINTAMYNYSDLNMASTTTINSTSYQTFATVTYTPKSSTSYLWIEFSCTYTVAGTSTDDFWSNIEVAGGEIVNANQVWTGQVGGGTRSGVMFPLAARYTNSGTAGIAISVRSKKGTSDDTATIYGNTASGFMRIQEIGR